MIARRSFVVLLSIFVCLSLCVPVSAAETDDVEEADALQTEIRDWANAVEEPDFSDMSQEELNDFIHEMYLRDRALHLSEMSIDELNDFIHELYLESQDSDLTVSRAPVIRLAWLAAAEIVYLAGFRCAGTVVISSAEGIDYDEANGIIAEEIKTTSAFKQWRKDIYQTSIEFTKADNADLFYAIHLASISWSGNSSGVTATVRDTFDFQFETDMQDIFSTLVNDWAWLCQNMDALTPISVTVAISL